ncbi:hypothetical protein Bca52824_021813 [Brassica carinata]|uniref:Uncharacterized protein n=1 Tax=Brassica carinata TaxID=52824 RepID=A0A8X7VFI2_BRACI|nr:hypothetical protein Bca52824_021813 [Brassica carinata]
MLGVHQLRTRAFIELQNLELIQYFSSQNIKIQVTNNNPREIHRLLKPTTLPSVGDNRLQTVNNGEDEEEVCNFFISPSDSELRH